MISFDQFQTNLAVIQHRLQAACARSGRPVESVRILPVTKTHPADAVLFSGRAGFHAVGENRVQEVVEKEPAVAGAGIVFELIGHLQSNKAKTAVEHCGRIQSVDSIKLAERINRLAGELGKRQRVLVQFNAGDDPAKFGLPCEEADAFFDSVLPLSHLQIEGLMTIAPLDSDLDRARYTFERLRTLRDRLEERFAVSLPELSMGMTGDLECAVEAGSTQIRIGSALFGQRG